MRWSSWRAWKAQKDGWSGLRNMRQQRSSENWNRQRGAMLVLEFSFVMGTSWEWIFANAKYETRNAKIEIRKAKYETRNAKLEIRDG